MIPWRREILRQIRLMAVLLICGVLFPQLAAHAKEESPELSIYSNAPDTTSPDPKATGDRLASFLIKREILESLFSTRPKTSRALTLVMSTNPDWTTPDISGVKWWKSFYQLNPLKVFLRKPKPIALTHEEELRYQDQVRRGREFRRKYFEFVWQNEASPSRNAYNVLKALLSPRESPNYDRHPAPLTPQRIQQLAQSDFETTYGLSPNEKNFRILDQVLNANPPPNSDGEKPKERIVVDPRREYQKLITRYEISGEEPRQSLSEAKQYLAREHLLARLPTIQAQLARDDIAFKEKHILPSDPRYKQNAHNLMLPVLKAFIAKMQKELPVSRNPTETMNQLQKEFAAISPAEVISKYDDGFGLGTNKLITPEFAAFVRDIKWWGLSLGSNYWTVAKRRFQPQRLRTANLMASISGLRAFGGLWLSIAKLGLYAAPIVIALTQFTPEEWRSSSREISSSRIVQPSGVQRLNEKIFGAIDESLKWALGENKAQATDSGSGASRGGVADHIADSSPDLEKPEFGANEGEPLKEVRFFVENPRTGVRMDPGRIPFIDRSNIADHLGNIERDKSERIGFALSLPGTSPDAEIQIRSALPIKPSQGRVSIPTPLGYKLVALRFKGRASTVYRNQGGNYYFTTHFPGAHTLIAQFKFEPHFFSTDERPLFLQSRDSNPLKDDAADIKKAGFYRLGSALYRRMSADNPPTFEEIEEIEANNSFYALKKPPTQLQPASHDLSSFYAFYFAQNRYRGEFIGSCTHGNFLLQGLLCQNAADTSLSFHRVDELLPEPDGTLTTKGHSQLVVTDAHGKILRLLDGTPRRTLPQSESSPATKESLPPQPLQSLAEIKNRERPEEVAESKPLVLAFQRDRPHPGDEPVGLPIQTELPPELRRFRRELFVHPVDPEDSLNQALKKVDEKRSLALAQWKRSWRTKLYTQVKGLENTYRSQKISMSNELPHTRLIKLLYFFRDLLSDRVDITAAHQLLGFTYTLPGNINLAEQTLETLIKLESDFARLKTKLAEPYHPSPRYRYYFSHDVNRLFETSIAMLEQLSKEIQAGIKTSETASKANEDTPEPKLDVPWNANLLQAFVNSTLPKCAQTLRLMGR